MKIALLSRNRKLYSTRRIIEAAEKRGHEIIVIDVLRAYMNVVSHKPSIHYKGEALEGFDKVLAVLGDGGAEDDLPGDLQAMIVAREAARTARDWSEADRIRDALIEAGISIEDTPEGTRWKRT